MANPQLENGRTEIANELVEALAKTSLTVYQGRVLWAILRKTYGWHKKSDRISLSQLSSSTGLPIRAVARAVKELELRHVITRDHANRITEYSVQKDYELWLDISLSHQTLSHRTLSQGTVSPTVPDTVSRDTEILSPETDTKALSKAITKARGGKIYGKQGIPGNRPAGAFSDLE